MFMLTAFMEVLFQEKPLEALFDILLCCLLNVLLSILSDSFVDAITISKHCFGALFATSLLLVS